MKNRWLELFLILFLIVGAFWLGQSWQQKPQIDHDSSSLAEQKIESLTDQMQDLYEEDLQDYARLKSMEAKYESANDILAKIMTIFLAELGLKISQQNIADVTSPLPDEAKSETETCPPRDINQCPSLESMARAAGKNLVDSSNTNPSVVDKTWAENERKLNQVASESEVKDFLKSVEIKNFFSEIATSKSAGRRALRRLQGVFEGTLYYDDPETKPAEIYMSLDGTWEDGKVVGKNEVKLSRNGEVFSHSSGDGDLKGYKRSDSSNRALFVDLGGKSGYLQLYFLDGNMSLIGNYYQQTDIASFTKRGTARLIRR